MQINNKLFVALCVVALPFLVKPCSQLVTSGNVDNGHLQQPQSNAQVRPKTDQHGKGNHHAEIEIGGRRGRGIVEGAQMTLPLRRLGLELAVLEPCVFRQILLVEFRYWQIFFPVWKRVMVVQSVVLWVEFCRVHFWCERRGFAVVLYRQARGERRGVAERIVERVVFFCFSSFPGYRLYIYPLEA
ncbi:uncharacterized protein YALI1_E24676g [Yarrowia lipolytica]|jgi:hypothetical protein|uniref:Secreted protein n=1 Tax=Yarrowia lipolytica TaxID=4952 RepID=A0A1D8NJA5_YARLL|nr:hypothetical protein YALI1_E24676g [Yarrowia lipolytica]